MADLIRSVDWGETPLGPTDNWPRNLRTLVDTILDMPGPAVLHWGAEHVQIYNDAFIPIARQRHPRLLGQTAADAWSDVLEQVSSLLSQARSGKAVQLRRFVAELDGVQGPEKRVFDADWSPLRDEAGQVVGVLQTLFETTEQCRAQDALRESEARNNLLINSWAQAIWEADSTGKVVSDSPSWRAYTGQTVEEWLGYGWLDAIHPDDRFNAEQQWRDAVAARILVDAEFRLRAPDGNWRWTNVRAAPVLDDEGEVLKWAGMNFNIDAQKKAQIALRDSEIRYRTLFESIDEGYLLSEVLFDQHYRAVDIRFLEANPAAIRLAGRDFTGQRMREIDPAYEEFWYESYGRVALTGEPIRAEHWAAPHDRWFDFRLSRVASTSGHRVASVFQDITDRKQAELRSRKNEERQAYLLKISDALRPLRDPAVIQEVAARTLGEHLKVTRVAYVEVSENEYTIERDYIDGAPSMVGRHAIGSFGAGKVADYQEGSTRVVRDTAEDMHNGTSDVANFEAFHVRAGMGVPLIKDGVLVATLVVHMNTPRDWTPEEVALVEETAERTWQAVQRARAENELRQSEERREIALSAAGLGTWTWYPAEDRTEADERALAHFGLPLGSSHSLAEALAHSIHADDAAGYSAAVERALDPNGPGALNYQFRIRRAQEGERWLWVVGATTFAGTPQQPVRMTGVLADITDEKRATELQKTLLAELQHRVRNVLAMMRSLVRRSANGKQDVTSFVQHLEGRIDAMGRTQALLTRSPGKAVDLEDLIRDEMLVQAASDRKCAYYGPPVALSPHAAEVLTLAIHELATNSVKYGALGGREGEVTISWDAFRAEGGQRLELTWHETGISTDVDYNPGFGTELITRRVPYELKGRGELDLSEHELRAIIEFPLTNGSSILETDPVRIAGEQQ